VGCLTQGKEVSIYNLQRLLHLVF